MVSLVVEMNEEWWNAGDIDHSFLDDRPPASIHFHRPARISISDLSSHVDTASAL